MENTKSLETTAIADLRDPAIAKSTVRNFLLKLPSLFSHPNIRPPVLDEMQADIDRLVSNLALRYSDHTCVQLQFDELVAEGHYKLAQLVHKGELTRQINRTNFFRFFKAVIANHFRSLVQRHRFTYKRTGQKPPPRQRQQEMIHAAQADVDFNHRKHVEISLDDEEANVQVACSSSEVLEENDLIEDYMSVLTPVEQLVLQQLIQPNDVARCLASLDARIKRRPGSIRVDIRHEHMAEGIGLDTALFEEAVLQIRAKIAAHINMSEQDQASSARRSVLIQQLSHVFGVQVPPNLDETVVKRLFTIAARDQLAKVNGQVRSLLTELGALVPKAHGEGWACFGVLYKRNDRRCIACDLKNSCSVEAANVGLGKITVSPKLLGARNTRFPVVLPSNAPEVINPAVPADVDAMDVVAYLDETFTRIMRGGVAYFVDKSSALTEARPLFALERANPLRLRFCNPSMTLTQKLIGKPRAWYPPDGIDTQELQKLIDEHASEMFARYA